MTFSSTVNFLHDMFNKQRFFQNSKYQHSIIFDFNVTFSVPECVCIRKKGVLIGTINKVSLFLYQDVSVLVTEVRVVGVGRERFLQDHTTASLHRVHSVLVTPIYKMLRSHVYQQIATGLQDADQFVDRSTIGDVAEDSV